MPLRAAPVFADFDMARRNSPVDLDAHSWAAPAAESALNNKMIQLCLLQKADGSFALNDSLFRAVGSLTRENLEGIRQRMNLSATPDVDLVVATALAVVVLRLVFAKQRSTWELQEQKALAFLRSQPTTVDLDQMRSAVEKFFSYPAFGFDV